MLTKHGYDVIIALATPMLTIDNERANRLDSICRGTVTVKADLDAGKISFKKSRSEPQGSRMRWMPPHNCNQISWLSNDVSVAGRAYKNGH